jgi:hypothetical protein
MPVLEPYWRKQAAKYARPQPFGFVGEVMRQLIEHIEALESCPERIRAREVNQDLAEPVAVHIHVDLNRRVGQ